VPRRNLSNFRRLHLVTLDRQLVRCVAFVIDVVGRIGEDEIRLLARDELPDGLEIGPVAAEDPVIAEQPEIASDGDWLLRHIRHRVLVRQSRRHLIVRQQLGQFLVAEPDDAEIELLELQILQLHPQQILIHPANSASLLSASK
jgi:hypothetical protein